MRPTELRRVTLQPGLLSLRLDPQEGGQDRELSTLVEEHALCLAVTVHARLRVHLELLGLDHLVHLGAGTIVGVLGVLAVENRPAPVVRVRRVGADGGQQHAELLLYDVELVRGATQALGEQLHVRLSPAQGTIAAVGQEIDLREALAVGIAGLGQQFLGFARVVAT